MTTKFIEATDASLFNWGKFLVGRFDNQEWSRTSAIPAVSIGGRLLRQCGWTPYHILVLDLQTGEGICVSPSGNARADLNGKHQVWVCPLFEPFLVWLYTQDLKDLDALPSLVNLGTVPTAMAGYRRKRATDNRD